MITEPLSPSGVERDFLNEFRSLRNSTKEIVSRQYYYYGCARFECYDCLIALNHHALS